MIAIYMSLNWMHETAVQFKACKSGRQSSEVHLPGIDVQSTDVPFANKDPGKVKHGIEKSCIILRGNFQCMKPCSLC